MDSTRFDRWLPTVLAIACALAAMPSSAQRSQAIRLQASATIVVGCRFETRSEPISVKCTQDRKGVACAWPCMADVLGDHRRTEHRVIEKRDDGTRVVTILF